MPKTYVCSDIHSHLDVLVQALNDMERDDTLYIIGDMIDKGPDGVDALLWAMRDKRCKIMAGNHEMMMLQYLCSLDHKNEINHMETADIDDVWLNLNDGRKTYRKYKKLPEEVQQEIFELLQQLNISEIVVKGGRTFYLTHACFSKWDLESCESVKSIPVSDLNHGKNGCLNYDWRSGYVWDRWETHIPGMISITGHTVVQRYGTDEIVCSEKGDWYDIDCGLAGRNKHSRLAVMCLDDMSVKYYTPEKL